MNSDLTHTVLDYLDLDISALKGVEDDDSLLGVEDSGTITEPTDPEMERLLLDNLSSDSDMDEAEEIRGPPRKKRRSKLV